MAEKSFGKAISSLLKSDEAIGGVYVAGIGAIIGEMLPTPSDAVYFSLSRKWRVQLEEGKITPKQYWRRMMTIYYLLDASWWTIVLMTAILVKGDVKRKMIAVGAVVGAGAMIGVMNTIIRKDTELFAEKFKNNKHGQVIEPKY